VTSEETLLRAQLLMLQAKYWEAISLLEAAVPQMEPPRHRSRGRILLAKAYAKNPNWLRRAEEQLQEVLKADPVHVDAHYQLGLLYRAQGLAARAQGLFRRVLELQPDHREAAAELATPAPPSGGLLKRLFGRGRAS
jgi:Tfp pilus assembly protein PilF